MLCFNFVIHCFYEISTTGTKYFIYRFNRFKLYSLCTVDAAAWCVTCNTNAYDRVTQTRVPTCSSSGRPGCSDPPAAASPAPASCTGAGPILAPAPT